MKDSLKDQIEGKARELKGALKEKAGEIAGDKKLQDEGAADRVGGQVRRKIGEIEKVIGQ